MTGGTDRAGLETMTSKLPNLVIAGVAKCGTTSLFHHLAQHEQICPSDVKETDYFAPLRFPDGQLGPIDEYARHFDHWRDERYRMEASPSYCYGGRPVVNAVRDLLGRPRILISLRDPVRRFWSAYTFLQSMGRLHPTLTPDEYLDRCLAEQTEHTPLSVGRYVEWLPWWLEEFGPDLKIVFAEQLFATPGEVVTDILSWLGLEGTLTLDPEAHNPTSRPRSWLVARSAYQAKQITDRVLAKAPRARATLRSLYRRVNTQKTDQGIPDHLRARLAEHYAAPTAELGALFSVHGVTDPPAWLRK